MTEAPYSFSPTKRPVRRSSQQPEIKKQGKLLGSLREQGWFADKTSDARKAGKPDCRIGHPDYGQLDFELKFIPGPVSSVEMDTGLTKLQRDKLKEMNEHGMPAVGLLFLEGNSEYVCCNILRTDLSALRHRVLELPRGRLIDGPQLFNLAMEYLHDLGYRHRR